MFVNRFDELKLLKELFAEKKPKLILLYGRRRVGKTELLKQFGKKRQALYIFGRQESEQKQLEKVSLTCSEFFNDSLLKTRGFSNWDNAFNYLKEKLKLKKFPIFVDEFPFFVQATPGLPSILQEHWDNQFQYLQSFFVLCGSSMSMMEKLLGYKSPLYGRRTHQILLNPLIFENALTFFPKKMGLEKKIELFGVLGGTPAYLLEFDYKKDLFENIQSKILTKESFLFQDTLFVLREELDEPRNYFSILTSISKGNTQLSQIMNDTGLNKGVVNKYLRVLIDLHLVERKTPITEKKEKSRKGIYVLKDNYFKFWFKFVFENTDYIETKKQKKLIEEKIKPEFNAFIGKIFENICSEYLNKTQKNYLFGPWWHKDQEIDLIGLNEKTKQILFVECKWKNKVNAEKELKKLKEKTPFVQWNNKNRTEHYIIIAKSFKQKIKQANTTLIDLKDLKKTFK